MSAAPPMAITMGDASGVGPRSCCARRPREVSTIASSCTAMRASSSQGNGSWAPRCRSGRSRCRATSCPETSTSSTSACCDRASTDPASSARKPGLRRAYVERATIGALQGASRAGHDADEQEATQLSDPRFVRHTEMIAELCGAPRMTMMLTNGSIAVTHVSTHCALREAIDRCEPTVCSTSSSSPTQRSLGSWPAASPVCG